MPRVTRPLFSPSASGSLGNAVTFSTGRRGTISSKRRRPRQPNSAAQLATREYMGTLATLWANLTDAQRATWLNTDLDPTIAPYHNFLRYNARQYKNLPGDYQNSLTYDVWPSAIYPPTQATNPMTGTWPALTPGEGSLTLVFTVGAINDNWLLTIHHCDMPGYVTAYRNLKRVVEITAPGTYSILVPNLPAGLQYLTMQRISHTGKPRPYFNTMSGTVL